MKRADTLPAKIMTWDEATKRMSQWRLLGKTVAFTNGCFDIIHRGHIASLSDAAKEADFLIVALNSDESTKRLKGPTRPINDEQSRALVMASLAMVDGVVIFDQDTPLEIIKQLKPDVLVKGGDYTIDQIVGAKEVQEFGGRVVINPIVEGFSTTSIAEKLAKG